MNKKLLITVSLIAIPAVAMELTKLTIDQQAMPACTAEEKTVTILVDDQERELPARYSALSSTLKNLTADLPESYKEGIPLPQVSLATWQHIEPQLERVYESAHGDAYSRDEIIADYSQLASRNLIDLMSAVEYLAIPLLREISLELVQEKLTSDEILALPAHICSEVIKRRILKTVGPVVLKELVVCEGHKEGVTSVCITQDSKKIVSGSWDRTVRIWDMNGNQLAVCRGHEKWVGHVCVTKDNKIVSGSGDTTVRIWDMDGKELAVCRGHEDGVTSVCVTKDNKIVSGSGDTTVRIWDMDGNPLAVCRGHEDEVRSVCITQDNKKIISGSGDGTVRIWDMSGKESVVCRGHEGLGYPMQVCVSQDNRIISVFGGDRTMRIWDMAGNQQAVFKDDTYFWEAISACVSGDNKIVLGNALVNSENLQIWDMDGKQLAVCQDHVHDVNSICFTKDNKIVTGSIDETVRIWDMNGNQLAVGWSEGGVYSVCVTEDNKIVSGSEDGTVRIWERNDIPLFNRMSHMDKKQAKLIGERLEKTKSLLFELREVLRNHHDRLLGGRDFVLLEGENGLDEVRLEILREMIPIKQAWVVSKHFWQEVESILAQEELDSEPKKRKELEGSESNPAKKERLSKELTTKNKEEIHHE